RALQPQPRPPEHAHRVEQLGVRGLRPPRTQFAGTQLRLAARACGPEHLQRQLEQVAAGLPPDETKLFTGECAPHRAPGAPRTGWTTVPSVPINWSECPTVVRNSADS